MASWLQQNLITVLLLAVIGWMLWGRFVAPRLAGVESIDASRYLKELRNRPHIVLDVRTEAEWRAGHPKGAVHIPLAELAQRMQSLPKDRPIVCICASGVRSAKAAVMLAKAGFSPVYNFTGGFAAWQEAGLPVARR